MEPSDPLDLERSLSALLQRLRTVPHLPAEMARARRQFFGADRPEYAQDEAAMASALLRFGEWYALERESDVMGEVPLDSFRRRGAQEAEPPILQSSQAGVFLVERVENRQAQIRDLQNHQLLELLIDPGSLRAGDLLAGRLYRGSGGWVPSPVLGIHVDGAAIGRAFQRDLQQMRPDRRLNQAELEHLLFRGWGQAPGAEPLERLEARLEELLARGGAAIDPTSITDALRDAPSAGPIIGPIMDRMAIETRVDLEQMRRLLVQIWNLLAAARSPARETAEPAAEQPPPGRPEEPRQEGRFAGSLGQSLARRIEEGLARHENIEELFDAVGEMLGEDLADEDDGIDAVPDATTEAAAEPAVNPAVDLGDLEPLVREFLWETGQDTGSDARTLQRLVSLQSESPVPKIDLEYLDGQDLLRLLLLVYLESPPDDRERAVRSAHDVLARFYAWAERTQEYRLSHILAECEGLVGDVHRIASLSQALSSRADSSASAPLDTELQPCLMRVAEVHREAVAVQLHGDGEPVLVAVPDTAATELRTGDLLLGSFECNGAESGTLTGMVVVVPGELERLLG